MHDAIVRLFDFLALFVGGRGIANDAVQFGMGSLLWAVLAFFARVRLRTHHAYSDRLLYAGFLIGLTREFFMLAMAGLAFFNLLPVPFLERFFPPLEHAGFDLAGIFIVGAFASQYVDDRKLVRNYLAMGSASVLVAYLFTAPWWYRLVSAHPYLRFGKSWCDWLFHINGVFFLSLPLLYLLGHGILGRGPRPSDAARRLAATMGDRPSVWLLYIAPLALFPLSRAVSVVDLAYGERYAWALAPLEHATYLLAVFLLGGFFIRRLYAERSQALAELQALTTSLEEIVHRRTAELQEANSRLEEKVEERTRELKEMQRRMVNAEKLRAAGSLAAAVVHEFGSPIFAIRNLLEQFRKDPGLEPAQRELLDLAVEECHRLRRLMDNLRDFHRPQPAPPEEIVLTTLLQEVLAISRGRLEKQGIQVKTDFAPGLPPVKAARDQLKQVFFNILTNAAEAVSSHGTITVRTFHNGNTVSFSVGDTGPGIAPEIRHRLFEPFVSSKPDATGTGLGLAISYGIVKQHHGRIEVESADGCGTTVTIHLPAVPDADHNQPTGGQAP